MSVQLTQTDGRRRVRKALATLFAGALLAGGAVAAVPAHAQASVDPGVCHDGIVLADAYYRMGDIRTANNIIWNLVDMGCAEN